MHRRRIFTTIVSAGLLLIPFASGQFPGKNTVDNGSGSGAGVNLGVATETRESSSVQTTIPVSAPGSCKGPVQLLGLSDAGPYMPVIIDGLGPYNLAVSFEDEGTYLFSNSFCREFPEMDENQCFFTGDTTGEGDDEGDLEDTINTGENGFKFKYVTVSTEARIGKDDNHIVLNNYPTRIIKELETNNLGLLQSRFGRERAHGIIGLKNSGDFIRNLASACNQQLPGWGINLQAGSLFSFGGIDSMASSIGTNDTSDILTFNSKFKTAEIRPIITNPNNPANIKFTVPVVLDTMVPFNTIPNSIGNSVGGPFVNDATVDITISGVTVNIPWTSLVHAGSESADRNSELVLGTPFFQYVYAAMFPGSGQQNIVIARDNGVEQVEFKPFSDIKTNLPTKTQPNGGTVTSPSERPDRKADDSSEGQPAADVGPAMTKPGSNIGAIVGGVVGGIVGLLIIIVAACCFYRRRKLMKGNPRGIEKEYEAEFDAEIGHHDGFFPQFKESGYATLPTPPPPPSQARPQIPSLILGSPINIQYDNQTEYTPTLGPYHDESPSRSLNVTPLPPPGQMPILTIPPVQERRLSVTPSLSIEPPSPLSRNVSAASRQNFPSIAQLQRSRSNVGAVPEEDDYDVVSMVSGPAYNPILASQEASSSAPRLPFMHRPESDRGMGMTDRGAGL